MLIVIVVPLGMEPATPRANAHRKGAPLVATALRGELMGSSTIY
jgi:hypothetical protein